MSKSATADLECGEPGIHKPRSGVMDSGSPPACAGVGRNDGAVGSRLLRQPYHVRPADRQVPTLLDPRPLRHHGRREDRRKNERQSAKPHMLSPATNDAGVESRLARLRLAAALTLGTIGSVGMW